MCVCVRVSFGGKQCELHRQPCAQRDDISKKSSLSDALKGRPQVHGSPSFTLCVHPALQHKLAMVTPRRRGRLEREKKHTECITDQVCQNLKQ